jgi:hypothetical protein
MWNPIDARPRNRERREKEKKPINPSEKKNLPILSHTPESYIAGPKLLNQK